MDENKKEESVVNENIIKIFKGIKKLNNKIDGIEKIIICFNNEKIKNKLNLKIKTFSNLISLIKFDDKISIYIDVIFDDFLDYIEKYLKIYGNVGNYEELINIINEKIILIENIKDDPNILLKNKKLNIQIRNILNNPSNLHRPSATGSLKYDYFNFPKKYDVKIINSTNKVLIIVYSQDHIVDRINDISSNINASTSGVGASVGIKSNIISHSEKKANFILGPNNKESLVIDGKSIFFNCYFINKNKKVVSIKKNICLKKNNTYIFEQSDIDSLNSIMDVSEGDDIITFLNNI
jgi:hypothetical protein